MLLEQPKGEIAIECSTTEKISGYKLRVFVDGRGRRLESNLIAQLGETRAHFRVFGHSKVRIEIASVQQGPPTNAQVAGDEESGITDLAGLQRLLGK
jgi:hypothetical protein